MVTVAMKKMFDRSEPRTQVLPIEISGLLTQPDRNIQIPFLVWDVSEAGIGLWTSRCLNPGTQVVVTVGHPYLVVVDCRVVWCSGEEDEGFRLGLELIEGQRAFRGLLDQIQQDPRIVDRCNLQS
ncbi:MAG: PilZ domain-containing protein [Oligoflexus sp.]